MLHSPCCMTTDRDVCDLTCISSSLMYCWLHNRSLIWTSRHPLTRSGSHLQLSLYAAHYHPWLPPSNHLIGIDNHVSCPCRPLRTRPYHPPPPPKSHSLHRRLFPPLRGSRALRLCRRRVQHQRSRLPADLCWFGMGEAWTRFLGSDAGV